MTINLENSNRSVGCHVFHVPWGFSMHNPSQYVRSCKITFCLPQGLLFRGVHYPNNTKMVASILTIAESGEYVLRMLILDSVAKC
jgi:hypothetical protein